MKNKKIFTTFLILTIALCSFVKQQGQNINLVFIGDSITHGGGLKDFTTQAPPVFATGYLLKQAGFHNVMFSNQGVNGFTTIDFLPDTKKAYPKVIAAANGFYNDKSALLVFSIMLGTNDSAVKGPNGAPVTAENYHNNLKTITDSLLARYPECKIIINKPIWYSDSTRNARSTYFTEGRNRLQSYWPEIKDLIKGYKTTNPGHVYIGDTQGFDYFKKHYLTDLAAEKGPSGIFYLHPNQQGAVALGNLWGKAIAKALK